GGGEPFANYWMHTNHITVSGQKVSKSLGNGITLEDIEAKGFTLPALRLHIFESHYRSQSKFSWESLESAQNRLKDYQALADLRFQPITAGQYELKELGYSQYQSDIINALQDDLNTPEVLRIVSLIANNRHNSIHAKEKDEFVSFLVFLDSALGLQLLNSKDIDQSQKDIIAQREEARQSKDWAKSDQLRNQLTEQGIGLRDTEYGSIWSRL
ncbi:MAG TPA: class I tRNA ligase family protein, partial [Patescibacteria group bacterium]|nr:class I tRNA ligase family protein [Patescibacteria group bacterium]